MNSFVHNRQLRDSVASIVVRFAGDSGDGMQLTGSSFMDSTALNNHDLATLPDYPAEIRAPAGTTFGVSAYQINFGAKGVLTSGDAPDMLVAMNPAALKVNLDDLRRGGTVMLDSAAFTKKAIERAGYSVDPRTDGSLDNFSVLELDITGMTLKATEGAGVSKREGERCKNIWTLGLVLWMFGRDRAAITETLKTKFKNKGNIAEAAVAALNAGHAYGETTEVDGTLRRYQVAKADPEPGTYKAITGAEATSLGLVAGAELADLELFLGSYPITPASPLLHSLSKMAEYGVTTFQAEDEIAAICAALGASFAGKLGLTTSSGPGIALKTEALGLAISAELPLVVVNAQRGGPSTGLPTKTEQSDLFQAVMGRNGDAPVPVIAACTPADAFESAIEAVRLAVTHMTPVILLLDGYIANASEPWKIPSLDSYAPFPVAFQTDVDSFAPFKRNPDSLARQWALPGTPGLEHRVGGLEKDYDKGTVSYDGSNHEKMTRMRSGKLEAIARSLPPQGVELGAETGKVALLGWGSTYGALHRATRELIDAGHAVSHIHLRNMAPFPTNLKELLAGFDQIIVPEMNAGQLALLLRAHLLRDVHSLSKVTGQPFRIAEITDAVHARLEA